ncbi:MAG: threonine synthase [Oscillospiraceae bacterium]|nr:threonine synthase [Oscillospiraceae bacterium]
MRYVSTRDKNIGASAQEAIARGLAPGGGLYAPEALPCNRNFWKSLIGKSYAERTAAVMGQFLDGFGPGDLETFARRAYESGRFDAEGAAPLRTLPNGLHVLELWHGPTAAFKDMALQILPHLLTASLKVCGEQREALILTATSGDTGKAALEGFRDVPGTRVLVFFPRHGVSLIQELQMTTQEGANVGVVAVRGNFDDAQTGVKKLFGDPALSERIDKRGLFFSSANSINLGRLIPQVAYYFSAYADMVGQEAIAAGQPIHICVPTGNFGNILSALYAWDMGLPVSRLLCASNRNNVLTDFVREGVYDRRRTFYSTMSPSMDILVSSNLERALFLLSGGSDVLTRDCMESLREIGRYTLPKTLWQVFRQRFYADWCGEGETRRTIASLWKEIRYLSDPHTAVAFHAAGAYREETGDKTPILVVSTASPYKFCDAVLTALGETPAGDGEAPLEQLHALTGWPVPESLRGLSKKPVRFDRTVTPEGMEQAVWEMVGA